MLIILLFCLPFAWCGGNFQKQSESDSDHLAHVSACVEQMSINRDDNATILLGSMDSTAGGVTGVALKGVLTAAMVRSVDALQGCVESITEKATGEKYEGVEDRLFGTNHESDSDDGYGGHRTVYLNPYFRRVLPEVYEAVYRAAQLAVHSAGWEVPVLSSFTTTSPPSSSAVAAAATR